MKVGEHQRARLQSSADVESTCHVTATVHKPNTSSKMADGGEDLILIGDSFEAILDIFDEDEVLQEQFSTAASEVSAEYLEAYSYLVYNFFFEGVYGATR